MMFRVFEWIDPETRLPRWIGLGKGDEPWNALWERRCVGVRNPLYDWLRTLPSPPPRSTRFLPDQPVGIRMARGLKTARIRSVRRWAGGDVGLINLSANRVRRPVTALREGSMKCFPSVTHAAWSVGVDWRILNERIETGCSDRDGWTWYDGYVDCIGCKADALL